MKRLLYTVLLIATSLLFLSCSRESDPQPEAGPAATPVPATDLAVMAEPVAGWDAVNNLYREGDVYFAGQPDSTSFVRFATEAGIETVINIRYPEELESLPFDEPALIRELDMEYVNIPVSPETLSKEDLDNLQIALDAASGPVLIHCGSSNRVGGTWAAHLALNKDMAIEEALERGRAAGMRAEAIEDAVRRVVSEN